MGVRWHGWICSALAEHWVRCVTGAAGIVPRLGDSPGCSPLAVADGTRAVPYSVPGQVGWFEVLKCAKRCWASQRREEEGSLCRPGIALRARAAIVVVWLQAGVN